MHGLVSWFVLVAAFAAVAGACAIMTVGLCRIGVRSLRPAGDAGAAGTPPPEPHQHKPLRPEPSLADSSPAEPPLTGPALP